MAIEFKRLSDVNVIESMSDSTNVLIEENGEIVKMSGNKMISTGVVKSVNGVTPDEAGNVVMSGLPEGAISWSDFGESTVWSEKQPETEITCTFDNNINRYTCFITDNLLRPDKNYKVIWDDKEYICTSYNKSNVGYIVGSDDFSQYPFMITTSTNSYVSGQTTLECADDKIHTVGVYLQDTVVTPIPKEYLPEGVLPIVTLYLSGSTLYADSACTTAVTGTEIQNAVNGNCWFVVKNGSYTRSIVSKVEYDIAPDVYVVTVDGTDYTVQ